MERHDEAQRDPRLEVGRQKREQILGRDHVAKNTPSPGEFAYEWANLSLKVAWGEVWSRGIVEDRVRSMITVAMLAALGAEEELAVHLRSARNLGVSAEELREVLIHVSIYAGFARARTGFRIAAEVMSEH